MGGVKKGFDTFRSRLNSDKPQSDILTSGAEILKSLTLCLKISDSHAHIYPYYHSHLLAFQDTDALFIAQVTDVLG